MFNSLKKTVSVLLLVVLIFSLTGCLKSNDTRIKETINTFFEGFRLENKQQIASVLDITFPNRDYFLSILDTYFVLIQYTNLIVTINSVTITGNVASVNAITLEAGYYNGNTFSDQAAHTFTLTKRDNKWLITSWD